MGHVQTFFKEIECCFGFIVLIMVNSNALVDTNEVFANVPGNGIKVAFSGLLEGGFKVLLGFKFVVDLLLANAESLKR